MAAASTKTDRKIAGMSSSAVEKATGKGWDEWLAILDKAGARKMSHPEIALYLHEKKACPPWWSQMVTVGYEQERGLREKHQTATGYNASASRTVAAPLAALFREWSDAKRRAAWLEDAGFTVRKATRDKSLRILWVDGKTSVEVNFYAKGAKKSQVAVQHGKLADAKAVAKMKAYWGGALDRLRERLEG